MKIKNKKKAALAAAVFLAAMNLSACAYGPPTGDEETDTNVSQTEYDPEENVAPAVYGPPPEE